MFLNILNFWDPACQPNYLVKNTEMVIGQFMGVSNDQE